MRTSHNSIFVRTQSLMTNTTVSSICISRMCLSLFFLSFIEGYLIYNVVIISAVQQSASVIYIHTSILFLIIFQYGLSQNNGQSSLCYEGYSCWPVTNIPECAYINTKPSVHPSLHLVPLVTISLFSKSMSPFLFCK